MSAKSAILFETNGNVSKRGVAQKSGNQYIMVDAYVHIEGVPYPQLFQYYCSSDNEILQPGYYLAPVNVSVKDGRLDFYCDIRGAKKVDKPAPQRPVAAQA